LGAAKNVPDEFVAIPEKPEKTQVAPAGVYVVPPKTGVSKDPFVMVVALRFSPATRTPTAIVSDFMFVALP